MSASAAKEEMLSALPDRGEAFTRQLAARDEVQRLLGRLSDREREIVQAHFGLGPGRPSGYDELSTRLGLTRQRMRQIEAGALAKLRAAMVVLPLAES